MATSSWLGVVPDRAFSASSSSERVAFRQINKKTGHRLKQQLIDSVTGEIVEAEDRSRGYEISKEEYLPIEDAELDAIEVESTHTIEIQGSSEGTDRQALLRQPPLYCPRRRCGP